MPIRTITLAVALFLAVMLLLLQWGLIDRARLIGARRHAIVCIFLVGAVVTPPDLLSQIVVAIPLLAAYELVIRLVAR